ncbi:transcriptional regulator [Streptomyces armeniacus]|uniref:Transcriptional regulator n=1 Tax=Streptomyces armeniacus TaxID=83291 RepID=A0A345XYX2_9ACTN|nr:helix-turn-helix domain-containing protein [Streptomyces armeniacus]AXK36838.1 transcriptional regulator [Streptomyces armeniacus]
MAEATASLKTLERETAAHPGERAWLAAHLPAYRERKAADPVTAQIVAAALGRSWNADYLTPTPRGEGDQPFEAEVARIRETAPEAARTDLTVSLGGPLPARLHRSDLPERTADLVEWVWAETVLPYWPRRRRVIEADIVARTAQLGQGGWAATLDDMRPGMRWLGESRLQINTHDYPPHELAGAQMLFVPVTPRQGWVSWEDPGAYGSEPAPAYGSEPAPVCEDGRGSAYGGGRGRAYGGGCGRAYGRGRAAPPPRYAVVYPCAGALAEVERAPVPEALGALLGPARARVLALLDTPKSTTQLVALTGQRLGSVGRHLRVLLDARLIRRRRAGRSVLYFRTDAGETLVAAQRGG